MKNTFRSMCSRLPKPVLFGIFGAVGCVAGGLLGEPILNIIKPASGAKQGDATPSVLVFNQEFNRRLEREGAETGDIQLSLMWNNKNDLDLHCTDPNGEEIYFSNKVSRSKGKLDVDMNAGATVVDTPVENIRWTQGKAPSGQYRVYVNHYQFRVEPTNTSFTVGIKNADSVKEYTGSVSQSDGKKLGFFREKSG